MVSKEGSFSIEGLQTDLQKLEEVVPQDIRVTGLRLICKILENILNHPEEPKFLSVNRLSRAYHKKILLDGAPEGALLEAILFSCGFAAYTSKGQSPRGSSAEPQDTLQLLPCVRPEDVAACLTLVTQRLHGASPGKSTTPARSEAVASSTAESLPSSRRLPPSESPADIQLRAIRQAHARRFENHAQGRREADVLSGDTAVRGRSPGSGNAVNPDLDALIALNQKCHFSSFRPCNCREGLRAEECPHFSRLYFGLPQAVEKMEERRQQHREAQAHA